MPAPLTTANFDYVLPGELIAQFPARERDRSRLLVLDRNTGSIRHRTFRDLAELLVPGDLLVINDAKVVPARLIGRSGRGIAVEVLLLRETDGGCWEALIKPSRKVRTGDGLVLANERILATVFEKRDEGRHLLHLAYEGSLGELLWRFGRMPLPPYIKRQGRGSRVEGPGKDGVTPLNPTPYPLDPSILDRERYQTVYAAHEGAVAAPTAGLHFTSRLIAELEQRGITVVRITLYVGSGTFRPVRTERIDRHRMEPERYLVPEETVAAIKSARAEGRRVISVGTTTVRALEHAAATGDLHAGAGTADLFIYPGYRFKIIDALITNFHLPRSTLLMLVSAFAGREAVLGAYREAIARQYRFYSYGDGMLIV